MGPDRFHLFCFIICAPALAGWDLFTYGVQITGIPL